MDHWIGSGLIIGAGVSLFGGMQVIFGNIEKYMSKEAKATFVDAIRQSDLVQILGRAPSQFTAFFDVVFGRSWLSLRFYYHSAVLSTVTVLLALIIAKPSFDGILRAVPFDPRPTYVMFFVSIFMVNLIVDMVSISKSRMIIRKIGPGSSLSFLSALLVLDIVLSIIVYCAVYSMATYAHAVYMGHTVASLADFVRETPSSVKDLLYEVLPKIDDPCAGRRFESASAARAGSIGPHGCRPYQRLGEVVSFYSSFVASIWLWVYMVAIFLFKARFAAGRVHRTLTRFLDFENHPISAVGLIVSAVACTLVWTFGLISVGITAALGAAVVGR